jgi:hypothetical protein
MDKKDWFDSRELLKDLLTGQRNKLEKLKRDIEEVEFTISCYDKKVGDYKPKKGSKGNPKDLNNLNV